MKLEKYAIYLPAVNELFARTLVTPIPSHRPFPSDISLSDLEFWKDSSSKKLWHYPYMLHSVGSYRVGQTPDNAITRRGRTDGLLVGDSGGFQIGKGSMDGLEGLVPGMSGNAACDAWRDNYDARLWILNWLETYTNYAMTIDMPTWAKSSSPFYYCTPEQLTNLTVENLKFIDSHRKGRTKWLNVIQGSNFEMSRIWWDRVKWFKCSGYSLSPYSARVAGLAEFIKIILLMRDEKAFDAGHDWIHVLGVSTPAWAVVLSAIQNGIRKTANPKISVSYDSADPFTSTASYGNYMSLPVFSASRKDWVIQHNKVPENPFNVGSDSPAPLDSPIGKKLTMGLLNVKNEQFDPNQFDSISQVFIMHHNVWTFVKAFEESNNLMFESDRSKAPNDLKQVVDEIEMAFQSERWLQFLNQDAQALRGFKR